MELNSSFENRISELRKELGISLAEMSKIINDRTKEKISAQSLNRYELKQREAKINIVTIIAKTFQINPLWLCGYNVDKRIETSENFLDPCEELNTLCHQMNELGMEVTIAYAKYVLTNEIYKKETKQCNGKKIVA